MKWEAHDKGVPFKRVIVLQSRGNLRGHVGGSFNIEADKILAYRGAPFFYFPNSVRNFVR